MIDCRCRIVFLSMFCILRNKYASDAIKQSSFPTTIYRFIAIIRGEQKKILVYKFSPSIVNALDVDWQRLRRVIPHDRSVHNGIHK